VLPGPLHPFVRQHSRLFVRIVQFRVIPIDPDAFLGVGDSAPPISVDCDRLTRKYDAGPRERKKLLGHLS